MPLPRDRVFLLLLLLAALLGLGYNAAILLGYGPDEPRHMSYVKLLFDEHTLPRLNPDGSEYHGAHTFHPPLYYLILLPIYALFHTLPGAAGWHIVRLVSLLLCLSSLPLIYQIAERAGGGDRNVARLAVAQVALLPMFGMTAGTINNDSAVLPAVTVFLWLLAVKYPAERGLKAAAVLGVCLGLGGLCKATALLCDAVALLFYLLMQDGWKTFVRTQTWARIGVIAALTALLAGPWHVRSMLLYGTWTPLPQRMPTPFLPDPARYGALMTLFHPNFPSVLAYANWRLFYTLWSQKDWIPETVRQSVYLLLAVYCMLGLGGAAFAAIRRRRAREEPPPTDQRIAVLCPEAAFVVNWLAVIQVAMFVHWGWSEGGRYLIPTLSGLSIFLARGWRGILGPRAFSALTAAWIIALLTLNALTLYWLLHYLNPTFGVLKLTP
ncbi:MAG: hypothetical protein M3Y13_12680 [Armatimonadota bacterium]|nr:hypothetical protein [Armatimonadota bacterium]